MIILVILTIAVTVESFDGKDQSVSELFQGNERTDMEGQRKLLPLWQNRRYVTLSPVGKKILHMSGILGNLLKEDQRRLDNMVLVKAQVKAGRNELEHLESRCKYREKVVKESMEKNLRLLDKLQSFVKQKNTFDSQLHLDLSSIYKDVRHRSGDKSLKKKASSSLILVMPRHCNKQ